MKITGGEYSAYVRQYSREQFGALSRLKMMTDEWPEN